MKTTAVHVATILIVTIVIFFINLGDAQLWDRDEPRNAGCAAEMMARGDFVVPIFNGELRYQKPVLLYWLIISSYEIFGINEFAARFWSAVLAVGSVLATYVIARRLLGSSVAVLASIMLATSLMFDVAARAATPDSVLIFCNTVALMIYVLATFAPFEKTARLRHENHWFPQSWLAVVAMYGAMGLGVLAKGLAGVVIPSAIIGMFMLIGRLKPDLVSDAKRLTANGRILWLMRMILKPFHPVHFAKTVWVMRPLTLVAVVLMLAGPWYYLVDLRTEGDFTQLFFWREHFGRATSVFENHRGGLWYYPLAILIGFFPWAVFWGPVAIGLKNESKTRLEMPTVFLLCWVGVQVGIFSIAQTKLPSYVTPCYGALAILTADCLYRWSRKETASVSNFWMTAALGGMILAGLLLASGFAYLCEHFLDGQWWLIAVGLVPITCGLIGIWQIQKEYRQPLVATNVIASVVLAITLFGFGTKAVSQHQNNRELLDTIAAANDEVKVATYRALESSWVFYGNRPVFELITGTVQGKSIVSAGGLDRARDWKPKVRLTPEQFVQACPTAMFVTTSEHISELKNRLPGDYEIIRTADFFLRDKELYLLAPKQMKLAVAPEQPSKSIRH